MAIVDLATLTGAIMVALGTVHAGLFCNDDTFSDRLVEAGTATGETLWRMPLGPAYDKLIDSPAADMKNIGGRYGGSITAAQFLQRFIQKGTPWAHLDIAGMAWSDKDTPTVPMGATAYGVRLLDRLVADHYEDKGCPAASGGQVTTEGRFYHLQRARLEEVLPVILERCHQRAERVLVLAGSSERVEALAALLWTYKPDSFLPHGTAKDGEAARQPIYIGTPGAESESEWQNPNGAPVLILSDGAKHPRIGDFKLVCELFDGHDEVAGAAARSQWKACKEAGHTVVYFQQGDSGKWAETARG